MVFGTIHAVAFHLEHCVVDHSPLAASLYASDTERNASLGHETNQSRPGHGHGGFRLHPAARQRNGFWMLPAALRPAGRSRLTAVQKHYSGI
jgi:hypothetical protein